MDKTQRIIFHEQFTERIEIMTENVIEHFEFDFMKMKMRKMKMAKKIMIINK
jgi:hypothetical protein